MLLKDILKNKELLNQFGVYQITCIPNKKRYIGSTCVSFWVRLKDHLNKLKRQQHLNAKLQRVFDKHGVDSFEVHILEVLDDKKAVRQIETNYINSVFEMDKGDGIFKENSLNICKSGSGSLGREVSEYTRAKISKTLMGKMAGDRHPLFGTKREPTMLGKKHTEDALSKMRGRSNVLSEERKKQISIQMKGSNHPLYGKPLSEKRRIALDRTGHISNKRKKLYQYKSRVLIKIYDCMLDAKKEGFSTSHIGSCIKGKRNHHKGYQWSFTPI